ncbi:glycosyltransferase [Paraclostridium sordellii]|uniref:glycosyltransferase n=1 Tax=Paraclostridium sordellii TaxID=1505 RepID=UPI0005DF857C|nr:glycosyltransferase [Paeniclostridium sordellii]MBX9181094.1 glycosyltransferase [Paeniclostridium sordellii]CEO13769.1 group 1 glycosyl transferase [[Clostridium] sordellii] [Paeniclostridium sordellii]CEP84981.1 group 1 glycosyl transferase [[Clostridium] sordellii] [Paeniclostridium sordellii]CEQ18290.1 group 1 glycosyl transferase [[Clostridium] sordellii] [Paeniclostridium sordellii]CEQ28027.1 group 1 glycosyl transferase [[Clostridium] sordellii] [Paeniclostridium sordellii]
MKVLQINSVCGIGSTGRIATDLYKVLEEQNHECKIAYGRGTAPQNIDSIKIGSTIDNYFHVFKTRVFDKHGFGSVNATKKFIEEIKDYDPDIIHLHNIHGYYLNIEVLFKYLKEADKPVIWTLHDCWPFTGHCSYFEYVECEKWKSSCENCVQKKEYPTSKLLDGSKLNYAKKKELFTSVKNMTIVTPSKWLSKIVKESFLGKYPIEVINNGIDLDVFKPTDSNFRDKNNLNNKFIVLGVANIWVEKKGLKYLTELEKNLNDDYKFVIVGVDEKKKNELSKNIIAITRTNNVKELAEIYTAADVFVNPTLEDNFPTTNLEALACGTPVLTFETGGSVECVDEKCGAIVPKKELENLKQQIIKIKENNFDSADCIKKSKKYDKRKRYDDYIRIYRKQLLK